MAYAAGLLCCANAAGGGEFHKRSDFGLFGGTSYYLGDINPRKQFYAPGISVGALLKHNFNEHHCLRASAYYGSFKGNDLDFKNAFQQDRQQNFSTSLIDLHIGYEFNFLPFTFNREHPTAHTPYIFFGLGYAVILKSTVNDINSGHMTIPFGAGYKYQINPAIGVGCEWGMRKTFTDKIDGVVNPGTYAVGHNNDWCSFIGIFITFRIFEESFACPAYTQPIRYK
ncbi:MAG: PorT family protein [Bacteroidales bacterium]|jgi:hypothetical protein|nr:PorT family protein [Bacteroidales bacterium]